MLSKSKVLVVQAMRKARLGLVHNALLQNVARSDSSSLAANTRLCAAVDLRIDQQGLHKLPRHHL